MKSKEALRLLRDIANKATLEDGEVDKELLYDAFFEEIERLQQEV